MQVDLVKGEGLQQCLAELSPLAAIINTAAMSSPGACERDPDIARYGIKLELQCNQV